jgi:flagellar basal body rod protein FlgC
MSRAIPMPTARGYVTYPNVNPVMEMADLLSALQILS